MKVYAIAVVLVAAALLPGGSAVPAQTQPHWPYPDAGSKLEPVLIAAEALPYSATVHGGVGYYRVAGLPPGGPLTVSLTGLRADADLFVFTDPAFFVYSCSSQAGGTAEDRCTTAGPAGTTLYVQVYTYAETPFTLDVTAP